MLTKCVCFIEGIPETPGRWHQRGPLRPLLQQGRPEQGAQVASGGLGEGQPSSHGGGRQLGAGGT